MSTITPSDDSKKMASDVVDAAIKDQVFADKEAMSARIAVAIETAWQNALWLRTRPDR